MRYSLVVGTALAVGLGLGPARAGLPAGDLDALVAYLKTLIKKG